MVLTGKILIRSLWQLKILWGKFVGWELQMGWKTIFTSLKEATDFKYSRQISSNGTYRLHIFADSPLIFCAAVAYLKNQHLLTKTRLVPGLKIPESELMAMTHMR